MKLLSLSNSEEKCILDDEDFEIYSQWKWMLGTDGSVTRNRRKKERRLHRIIMNAKKGEYVDHINRNRLDNRKENLRICTNQQNNYNRGPSKGKFKGPSWNKNAQKWASYIKKDSKTIYLGLFLTEEEAAHAYDTKAKELFGEFAYLNFP